MPETFAGGCLCGGVRYVLDGPLRPVAVCHCTQCRKTSGHVVAATRVPKSGLHLEADATLAWYASTPGVRRGFCGKCGGNLFWERVESPTVSVMAGTLDGPSGLKIDRHIYVADKGDYDAIPDDVPSFPGDDAP